MDKSETFCICGSTRYKDEMMEAARTLTLAGGIVLMPHVFKEDTPLTEATREALDRVHREKIARCDRVVICHGGEGYVGESTRGQITHAQKCGKFIQWWDSKNNHPGGPVEPKQRPMYRVKASAGRYLVLNDGREAEPGEVGICSKYDPRVVAYWERDTTEECRKRSDKDLYRRAIQLRDLLNGDK